MKLIPWLRSIFLIAVQSLLVAALLAALLTAITSCGVKAPPLPPEHTMEAVRPVPSLLPSPVGRAP